MSRLRGQALTARRALSPGAALTAGVILAWSFLLFPWIEPARLFYPIAGTDVSHHNGAVSWRSLKESGVRFAYIKASEGGDYRDPRFAANWREAGDAGVLRGAYHFFTLCTPGAVQARNFLATVPADASALPPALDAEHMGPCRKGPRVTDVSAEIAAFLREVAAVRGERPLIYTTEEFHRAHLAGKFEGERFWLRSLVFPPSFRRGGWVLWQYHSRGRRAGIAGPVDLNVFRGDEAAFARFAAGTGETAPIAPGPAHAGSNPPSSK